MMKKMLAFFVVLCLCMIFISNVSARTLNGNISKLNNADVIFIGRCISAKPIEMKSNKLNASILVTEYTFEVEPANLIKGQIPLSPNKFVFKQWGATREETAKRGFPFVWELPLYKCGPNEKIDATKVKSAMDFKKSYYNESMLFLTKESGIGLRAPIGLGQGKFRVVQGSDGTKSLVNDRGNVNLFQGVKKTGSMGKALSASGISTQKTSKGPIGYDQFIGLVKNLQGGKSE